jgi:hypothetical protein
VPLLLLETNAKKKEQGAKRKGRGEAKGELRLQIKGET